MCTRLKADSTIQHIPVIFVSAENEPATMKRALEAGASRYLVKPIGLDDLERAIADTLKELEEPHE